MLRSILASLALAATLTTGASLRGSPDANACGYGARFSMTDLVSDAALADQVALQRQGASVHRVLTLNFATGQARVGVRWTERAGRVTRGQVVSLAREQSGAWTVVARTRPTRVWA